MLGPSRSLNWLFNSGQEIAHGEETSVKTSRLHAMWVLASLVLALAGCGGGSDDSNGKDRTAPVVHIAFPPNDTTLGRSVVIFAEATDNIAVSHIEFYIDAVKHCTDSSMPYTDAWNCSTVADSTTHAIFAKAYDAAGNAGSSDTISVLVRNSDSIPPGLVLDLAVAESTGSSVTLRWTAPGGDGATGRASLYDIRYLRKDIDPLSWENATQVAGEPDPATAGTSQTMTINGLSWGTTYQFALRTCDAIGNWSDISNLVSVTSYEEIALQQVSDCPPSTSGDKIKRGFYLTGHPAGQLAKVNLYVSTNVAGRYTLLMTARADTYDGALIGVGRAEVELSDDYQDNREATFLFPLPVINSDSVVTFTLQLVSGPSETVYYATNTCGESCLSTCPIIETEGTVPPLDTFRRFGMSANVYIVGQI
jgi:hypothetical protein